MYSMSSITILRTFWQRKCANFLHVSVCFSTTRVLSSCKLPASKLGQTGAREIPGASANRAQTGHKTRGSFVVFYNRQTRARREYGRVEQQPAFRFRCRCPETNEEQFRIGTIGVHIRMTLRRIKVRGQQKLLLVVQRHRFHFKSANAICTGLDFSQGFRRNVRALRRTRQSQDLLCRFPIL